MHVKRFLLAAVVLSLGSVSLSRGGEAAPILQMHRAVYDLSLLKADSMSDISNVTGRMVVEWRGGPSCDGYTSLQRVVTDMSSESGVARNDVRLSAWESLDGKSYRYERLTYFNGERSEKVSARVTNDPNAGKAEISIDGKAPKPLSGSVLFPAVANIALIEAAEAGQRIFAQKIFDGAEEKATLSTAFIGAPAKPGKDARRVKIVNAGAGKLLTDMEAWPVRVAYFDDSPGDSEPDFQMVYRLYPNGVVTKLELDYPDMSLEGHLVGLEYFSPGSC